MALVAWSYLSFPRLSGTSPTHGTPLGLGGAASLDACRATELVDPELLSEGRALLLRVVAKLTARVVRLNDPGLGSTERRLTSRELDLA
ncbi:hypothetical protein ACFL5O_01275 [Myxococcota bacterium]